MRSGSFPTLVHIRQDPWSTLKQVGQRQAFEKKEFLYRAGDPARQLYLLEVGRVRLFSHSVQGRDLTLSIVEPMDVFGEMAMFPDRNRASHAQALSDGMFYSIPRQQLGLLLERNPTLVLWIMENLSRRLQAVERRLGDLVFKSVPERLAALLLDLADPATRQSQGPIRLLDQYTHSQLAEMINSHRETVTKVLNRFKDNRLVEFDQRRIILLDMQSLREMALR